MKQDTAVVTGGAGFIGSHLVEALLKQDYSVVVIDDFSSGSASNLDRAMESGSRVRVETLDIIDDRLFSVMEEASPKYVFHLAAQTDVRHSMADPLRDARVNVVGSLNVIESARRLGVKRLLYAASGGTLYGEPDPALFPIPETLDHCPLSNYGVSKMAALDYLVAYREVRGLSYVALALANVYGPRQDPHGESGVVSVFAGNLLGGQRSKIYGDGGQTRDFVNVADVVSAFMAAMDSEAEGVFNISNSVETSIGELYWRMAGLLGLSEEPEFLSQRVGELRRSCLANSRAKELLGWTPQVDLDEGLAGVISWVKERD